MEEKVLYNTTNKREKSRKGEEIPRGLIGGTEVYQKNGSPYFYCRIKNGRDEFMYLPMADLTKRDLMVDSKTGKNRTFNNKFEVDLAINILMALKNKPKEEHRWIPVYEPSLDENATLQIVAGEKPLVGLLSHEWEKLIREYSPMNESSMMSNTTYFLLLLRWIKDGIVTIEQLAKNSRDIGHYRESEGATYDMELTGKRGFGGLYGMIGNTCKIVKVTNWEYGYALVGGYFQDEAWINFASNLYYIVDRDSEHYYSVALMELKR